MSGGVRGGESLAQLGPAAATGSPGQVNSGVAGDSFAANSTATSDSFTSANSAGPGTKPLLDVVIVNWNAGEALRECVASIAAGSDNPARFRVIVVDNASTDGSETDLDFGALNGRLIRNDSNRGFAAACNQGAAAGSAPAILFLNPDVLVPPGALERSLAFLSSEEGRGTGIVGVQLRDSAGVVSRSCARAPTPARAVGAMLGLDRVAPALVPPHFLLEWDHAASREVDQVMGAFLLIRRDLFAALGGFDERFFVYFEEVDLCVRAGAAGFATRFLAEAHVVHHGCGTTASVPARRYHYFARSRILYGFKHFAPAPAIAVTLATLFVEPVTRSLHALLRADLRGAGHTINGAARLWASVPALLRGSAPPAARP